MSDLPRGWTEARLDEIASVNPPPPENLGDDEIVSFVPMASVEAETGRLDPTEHRTVSAVRGKSYRSFADGDVLFAKVTPCMENGKIALANGLASGRGFGSSEFHVVRPGRGVTAKFILYFLLQRRFRNDAKRDMSGTAGLLRVSTRFLESSAIPVPPLAEQVRIVAAIEKQFSRLDTGVAALERVRQNLRRMRSTVLEAEIRGEWPQYQLKDVCESVTDGDHQPPPQTSSGIPFLVIGNVKSGHIDFSKSRRVPETYYAGLHPERRPQKGDVLYTVVGSYGIPVLVESREAFCVQRHIAILRPSQQIDARYLRYALETSAARHQADTFATGTAQMTVPLSGLRRLAIGVPPLAKQALIVARLDGLGSAISRIEAVIRKQTTRSGSLRSSILSAAFSGHLVAQDASDEPASSLLERIRIEQASISNQKTTQAFPSTQVTA